MQSKSKFVLLALTSAICTTALSDALTFPSNGELRFNNNDSRYLARPGSHTVSAENASGTKSITNLDMINSDVTLIDGTYVVPVNVTGWIKTSTFAAGDGATVTCIGSLSGGGQSYTIAAHDGGTMIFDFASASDKAIECNQTLSLVSEENGTFIIKNGGPIRAPSGTLNGTMTISGTMQLPDGLNLSKASTKLAVTQKAGSRLTIGGDAYGVNNTTLTWTIEGGSIDATGDAKFNLTSAGVFAAGAQVAISVPADTVIDMSAFTSWGAGSLAEKTGAGSLAVSSGAHVNVSAGAVRLATANTSYDVSEIAVASGAKIELAASGIRIDSAPAAFLAGTFAVDADAATANAAILTSTDSSILEKAFSDIKSNISSAYDIELVDSSIYLRSNYAFTGANGVTDWANGDGWGNGAVPPAGTPAIVDGAGVVARISSAVPVPGAITVRNGATLAIATTYDLPAITLEENSALVFENGANATLTNGFSTSGTQTTLPSLSVGSGAVLSIPAGTVLTFVKVALSGRLQVIGNGNLTIGTGTNGSGSHGWYGFSTDGATICIPNGTLIVNRGLRGNNASEARTWDENPVVLKDTTLETVEGGSLGFGIGYTQNDCDWNPKTGLTLDGTVLPDTGTIDFQCINPSQNRFVEIQNGGGVGASTGVPASSSRMVFGWRTPCVRLTGPGAFINVDTLQIGSATVESVWAGRIAVLDGATVRYRSITGGNGSNYAWIFGDGIQEVGAARSGESPLFNGAKSVEIQSDKSITIRAIDDTGTPADHSVTCAAVPMTGTGSLSVENAMGGGTQFSATITSGANTATGTASAGTGAKLLFTDGANWAGAVVSTGNIGFGGSSAATVSLASLSVNSGTLPVRIFSDGQTVTADRVNVINAMSFANGTGIELEITALRGVYAIPAGTRLAIASAPAGTATPMLLTEGFGNIVAEPDPDDANRTIFYLNRFASGLQIIFR